MTTVAVRGGSLRWMVNELELPLWATGETKAPAYSSVVMGCVFPLLETDGN